MTYSVEATPHARRELERLSPQMRDRVLSEFVALGADPRPVGAIALRGTAAGSYRLRVGDYRIGYVVDDKARTVSVWEIGDRKRFYQRARRRRR